MGFFDRSGSERDEQRELDLMIAALGVCDYESVEHHGRPLLKSKNYARRAAAGWGVTKSEFMSERFRECIITGTQAIGLGLPPQARTETLLLIGKSQTFLGRLSEARIEFEYALKILEHLRPWDEAQYQDAATALAGIAESFSEQGIFQEALCRLEESDEAAAAVNDDLRLFTNRMLRAETFRLMESTDEAVAEALGAVASFQNRGAETAVMSKSLAIDVSQCLLIAARAKLKAGDIQGSQVLIGRLPLRSEELPVLVAQVLALYQLELAQSTSDFPEAAKFADWFCNVDSQITPSLATEFRIAISRHWRLSGKSGARQKLAEAILYYETIDHQSFLPALRAEQADT